MATNPHNAPALKPPPLAQQPTPLLAAPDEDSWNSSADSMLSPTQQMAPHEHFLGGVSRPAPREHGSLTFHILPLTHEDSRDCFANNSAQLLGNSRPKRSSQCFRTSLLLPGGPTEAQPLAQRTTLRSIFFHRSCWTLDHITNILRILCGHSANHKPFQGAGGHC